MKKLKLLSYSKITAISSAVTALISQGSAEAGIVFFDVNPDLQISPTEVANFGDIDLVSETYVSGATTGNFFGIRAISNFFYFSGGGVDTLLYDGNYLEIRSRDAVISSSLPPGFYSFGPASSRAQTSANETLGATFLALRLDAGGGDYSYGWVQVLDFDTHFYRHRICL